MLKSDVVRIQSHTSNRKIINYRVTEKCNYKCPYCWFKRRTPVNLEGDLPAINNVLENLRYVVDYYIKQGLQIDLFLTGGEPSLYPLTFYGGLFDIIAEKKIKKVTLSTNFSADPRWFIAFAEKCRNNTFFEIKAAFHPSECNLDEYIEKIKKVKDSADKFIAHFTFDDNNFIGKDKIEEIKSLGVALDVVPIHSKKDEDYGKYKVTNPDLLDLISKKGIDKFYTIRYKDGSSEKITLNDVKEADFSNLKPICHHSDITIMLNKIGINCEYMRTIKRILPDNWFDISVKRTKKEVWRYLKNDCCIMCDKRSIPLGNNCTPSVLDFRRDNGFNKFCKALLKIKEKMF